MIENASGTCGDLADMGLELGYHEDGEHLFSSDIVRDVEIRNGRTDFAGVRVLEENSSARQKTFALDIPDRHLDDRVEQHCRADRHEDNQRGHGGSLELHRAAVDGNFGALHA